MTFLATLACTLAVCCALREPIRRVPWAFYLLAVALVVAFFAVDTDLLPRWAAQGVLSLMRKCMLPTALFVIVMYVGVLPKSSSARRWMQPLRTPLSIVACILVLGHMVRYFAVYAPRVLSGAAVSTNVLVSFVLAILLFALLAVLGVTSLETVRRHMTGSSWKRVQRFAYAFYALVYIHLMVMLAPSALSGRAGGLANVAVYTAVFGVYLALRIMRARKDAAARATVAATAEGGKPADKDGGACERCAP